MKKISWYLFRQTCVLTVVITVIITAALWLTQSIRFIDYVMNRGLGFVTLLKLSGLLVPGLMSTILPIAFLISIIFTLNRLYSDRELVVLKSTGLSNFQIQKPILLLAGICFLIVLAFNLELQPAAQKVFQTKKEEIRNNLTGQWIQPGQFMNFNQITFYTREKNRSGSMRGVLIYDARNHEQPVTIVAEYGRVLETNEGLRFEIFSGSRQTLAKKTRKPEIVNFDNYALDVKNPKMEERSLRLAELSFLELFSQNDSLSQEEVKNRNHEFHTRIIIPLLIFPFVFLAGIGFLKGGFSRRGRSKRILITVAICVGLETATIGILNAGKLSANLILAYGLVLSAALLSAIHLFADKGLGQQRFRQIYRLFSADKKNQSHLQNNLKVNTERGRRSS